MIELCVKEIPSLDIVNEVAAELQASFKEKGIEVIVTNDLPTIQCDRERIAQVFQNLLTNAIKYMGDTKNPTIEIGYDDNGNFHRFYVRDSGIGIDPKYHQKIFKMFRRSKEVGGAEGTGLGLAIVEKIVKSHGGKAWVESEKGKGATFYFTLPKKPVTE
jgi:signal transduction histidine kinase